jgi:UDP-GlcNAc:undecaprenyl-phosphate/decaprenyl-phosphate GlcNAc-1-phosphate transferase
MDNILLSAALSFLITFFAIPVIIQVAKDKKLFDEPDERKVHKIVIPTLGGLGIFAGFIMGFLMGVPSNLAAEIQFFAAAAIVIFFLGMKDDVLILSASKKFIGQLIAAGILIKFGGIRINSMHGFLGIYDLPNVASIVLSLFTIIVITNSFNLIDGIDGLAGSLGLVTTLVFGCYFYYVGQLAPAVMAFALAGSLISFLIYNFSPAKIFMGDTGSLLLGLINSILVIKFINMAPEALPLPIEAAPAIGLAILIIPLFDTLRVFALRLLDRRSPFSPDRNHIHHFLLDLGLSHKQITLTCVATNIFLIALAFSIRESGTTMVAAALLLTCFMLTGTVYFLRQRKKNVARSHSENKEVLKTRKILTFASSEHVEMD